MATQVYLPSPKLRSIVARYMINIDEGHLSDAHDTEIIPNGTAALGFSFGEPFQYVKKGEESILSTCGGVLGVHTDPYLCRRTGPTRMFVIIFQPFALFRLLKNDMDELKNSSTDLKLLGINESSDISDRLRDLSSNRERVRFVEHWLTRKLTDCDLTTDLSDYIVHTIIQRKGLVSIRALEKELKINRRYIERNFNLRLGLSSKEFAEVTRFTYISSQLIERPDISWQELIYLGNFHDQAHLIRHFQKLVRATPRKFRETIHASPAARFVNLLNVTQLLSEMKDTS